MPKKTSRRKTKLIKSSEKEKVLRLNGLNIFKNKTILITGGTGSFGKNFSKFLLEKASFKKLIIFSRDEFKQYYMQKELSDDRLRFFLGDIRDLSRLEQAFHEVDIVVHAAALKQVPAIEYNPFEAVKTNIIGSQNVIEAAINQKVGQVLLISSDKAVQPINLYGATKLAAEKLFVAANSYAPYTTRLSVVRYGNVVGSRGSVVEMLVKNAESEKVQITDSAMTRFWLTLAESFQLAIFALENMEGGEIFVPKLPSMKVIDLFDALVPDVPKIISGIRPGEKLHEILLTQYEAKRTMELEKYFVILPEFQFVKNRFRKYQSMGKPADPNLNFMSHTNSDWVTKEQFREIVKQIQL